MASEIVGATDAPTVGAVRRFLREVLGTHLADMVVEETFGVVSDEKVLTQHDAALLVARLWELFGCLGQALCLLVGLCGEKLSA